MIKEKTEPTLSTIKQLSEKQPAFTEGNLRYLIFHAETNGLKESGALLRIGTRILINEEYFYEWIQCQNN